MIVKTNINTNKVKPTKQNKSQKPTTPKDKKPTKIKIDPEILKTLKKELPKLLPKENLIRTIPLYS